MARSRPRRQAATAGKEGGTPAPGRSRPPLEDALAAAARRAFAACPPSGPPPAALPLELRLTVVPGSPWRVEAAPPVEEQIRRAVREVCARREAFRPGRVWCYRCDSADCRHAEPPAADCVFGGYGATGVPDWPRLAELLLQRRHPDVGALFGPASRVIAAEFLDGREITGRQLEAFGRGSKTYDVLAEAVFGLIALRPGADPGAEADRTAFTLQAVETRTARGAPRVDLNVLAWLRDGSPALDALAEPAHLRVLNVVTVARRRLRTLAPGAAGARTAGGSATPDLAERAAAILRDAVRALGRLGRQAGRRSRHAEDRGLERRPTAKAREDALGAPPECLLRDERRGTVVVLGRAQRVHVFSAAGRHVTSLALDPESVRRRRRRERWEPLDPAGCQAFREALLSHQDAKDGSGAS